MKLDVTGIETIEITDPKGLCKEDLVSALKGVLPGASQIPWQPGQPVIPQPQPAITTPYGPPWSPPSPYSGDPVPNHPSIWTKSILNKAVTRLDPDYEGKWRVGISEAQTSSPEKWEKNWQAKMSPEQQQAAFDHGYTAITQ